MGINTFDFTPDPISLLESNRNLGYSIEEAISDLIDNSILHGFSQNSFEQIQLNKINIDITADDKRVYIRYQDNGVGLQKTTKAQVFEPFYTTCRSQGESGLGMHIVYNLVVHKFAGKIQCQSTLGQGVTYIVDTPFEKVANK